MHIGSVDRALPPGQSEPFKQAMRALAGGVVVVTAGIERERSGLTATSVSSFSLDPATLIASVNRTSSTWPLIQRHGCFGVNILSERHVGLADAFAGRGGVKGEQRYAGAEWVTLVTGAPILADALAAFDCTLEESIDRNSHSIVIGKVEAVSIGEGGHAPLLYWRGNYGFLHRHDAA